MNNDNDELELIAYNQIEMIMTNPLSDMECRRLIEGLERCGLHTAINRQGRILTFDAHMDDLSDITGELADMGLVEDIGLIKVQITFEPQWSKEAEWTTMQ